MEILINELSLDSQFANIEDFINIGVRRLLPLLSEFRNEDVFLKKQDFYGRNVTSQTSIYEILAGSISRSSDELRKFKSYLSRFFDEPYWEINQKHDATIKYTMNGINVSGTSLAETCERDKILLSFNHNAFKVSTFIVSKSLQNISIDNVNKEGDFITLLHNRGLLTVFSLKNLTFFRRTTLVKQGQTVYVEIINGNYWYLDNLHKNHYEVFNSNKTHIGIADMGGNIDYTKAVNGRTI